jgi:hypothetical protein
MKPRPNKIKSLTQSSQLVNGSKLSQPGSGTHSHCISFVVQATEDEWLPNTVSEGGKEEKGKSDVKERKLEGRGT